MPGSRLARLRALLVESGGTQNESGGSSAAVSVVATGGGTATEAASGGSGALVDVVAAGAGAATEQASGGSGAVVDAAAVGAGSAAEEAAGGAGATVDVAAVGAGEASTSESYSGGSSASVEVTAAGGGLGAGAGRGSRKTLADYEAEWANSPPQTAQERRRLKREAARKVYLEAVKPDLPDVAQAYIDRLKAELDAARTAEIAALLDLQAQTSAVQADIARAAVLMAERRRAEIARQIEEFDVMYVAAILAEA